MRSVALLFVLSSAAICLTGCLSGSTTAGSSIGGGTNPTPTPTPTPAPTVLSISPSSGLTAGGTAVTIAGTNFFSTVTVKINGVSCTGATVVNSTTITCSTGATGAGGPYPVSVQTGAGTGTSGNIFTYTATPVPEVISLSPTSGVPAGGGTLTITGSNFIAGGLSIKFNGATTCTVPTYVSASEVICTIPALTNNTNNTVAVTTSGGTSGNLDYLVRTVPTAASSIYYGIYSNDDYCAILSDGSVDCWGDNATLQNSSGSAVYIPQLILLPSGAPLTGATKIAIGEDYACAIIATGVACWGYYKPDGSANYATTIIPTSSFGGTVTDIAAGVGFACVLLSTGNAQCWGAGNNFGAGMAYAGTTSTTPVYVSNDSGTGNLLTATTGITAGSTYACAVGSTGSMWCWGAIDGYNGSDYNVLPVVFSLPYGESPYANLSSSPSFTCASDPTNTNEDYLYCWGALDAGFGSPYQNFNYTAPNNYVSPADVVSMVAASPENICILLNPGASSTIYCWGDNTYGELGNGTTTGSSYTTPVFNQAAVSLSHVSQIAGLCGLTTTGAVECWGFGGGLGIASPPAYSDVPVAVGAWQ